MRAGWSWKHIGEKINKGICSALSQKAKKYWIFSHTSCLYFLTKSGKIGQHDQNSKQKQYSYSAGNSNQKKYYILHNHVVMPISGTASQFDYFGTWMQTKRYDYSQQMKNKSGISSKTASRYIRGGRKNRCIAILCPTILDRFWEFQNRFW